MGSVAAAIVTERLATGRSVVSLQPYADLFLEAAVTAAAAAPALVFQALAARDLGFLAR